MRNSHANDAASLSLPSHNIEEERTLALLWHLLVTVGGLWFAQCLIMM